MYTIYGLKLFYAKGLLFDLKVCCHYFIRLEEKTRFPYQFTIFSPSWFLSVNLRKTRCISSRIEILLLRLVHRDMHFAPDIALKLSCLSLSFCLLVLFQALAKRFSLVMNTITKFFTSFWIAITRTSIPAFLRGITRSDVIHDIV